MSQDTFPLSLVASPEPQSAGPDTSEGSTAAGNDGYNEFTIHRHEGNPSTAQQLRTNRAKVNVRNGLHPYVQTLSLSNLESCVALENAVFPEEERCSREKVADSIIATQEGYNQGIIYTLYALLLKRLAVRTWQIACVILSLLPRIVNIACIALMIINPFIE